MTTSTSVPVPTQTLGHERVALRIQLDNSFQSGPVDGAWWPQSRDLQVEAADLVDHFPHLIGRIERLLFSRLDWDSVSGAPDVRWIRAGHSRVKVDFLPRGDTHVMLVKMVSGERIRLLVVPSDAEPGRASRVMQQAADDRNIEPPHELLGL